jgi:hypothetical protein
MELFVMTAGFMLAAYAIVANDAIQTLGTFLSSNRDRPWWILWLYAAGILSVVLVVGWWSHDGDVSYGRLTTINRPPVLTWVYLLPPLVLLALTRWGMPVSTTFLILTAFSPKSLESMISKSLVGYALAFVVAVAVYWLIAQTIEKRLIDTRHDPPSRVWTALQWMSTGFLWAQWLVQDLANIYVYLPRPLGAGLMLTSLALMIALHGWIFYRAGGPIQKIVTSKINTGDIRAATIIDFMFGLLLLWFSTVSKIPMSTTWVFLGLLGGRELALTLRLRLDEPAAAGRLIAWDVGKAAAGLVVSVALALVLPQLAELASVSTAYAAP